MAGDLPARLTSATVRSSLFHTGHTAHTAHTAIGRRLVHGSLAIFLSLPLGTFVPAAGSAAPATTAAAPEPAALGGSTGGAPLSVASLDGKSSRTLPVGEFVSEVLQSNLDLAAQRFNVPIAKAQLAAARVSPNPVLNAGTGRDLTHEDQPTTYFAGLSAEVEIPGKRSYRSTAALETLLAASATLEDYLRTLRGTAASAYVDAVSGQLILVEKQRAFASLDRLANENDVRLKAGDISTVDDDQARADALQARGDVFASQSSNSANQYVLLQLLGRPGAPLPQVVDHLNVRTRQFNLTKLLADVLHNRPDTVAARKIYESTQATTRLTRLNRIPDPTLGVTFQEALTGRNPIDPTPNFNSINLSVSLPLPIFNSLRGEYSVAVYNAAQAEQTLRSTELKAEVDVRGSYARYQTAQTRLAQYQNGALELAAKVLEGQLLSYKTGSATLLDVLQAEKADTDVHLAYIDALTERAKAIIALEQAANIWDLDF
jgi:cobalt-zinc-cadmium efflux system outer membrane protein